MRYSLLLWLIYGILLLLPITVRAEDTQARFERVAAHLPLFPTSDFLYNRADLLVAAVPRELAEPYHLLLPQLVVPEGKTAELEKLLKHPDPKVRTLALAALFIRNDPKLLPQIAALVSDDAETFPDEAMLDQGVFSHISL